MKKYLAMLLALVMVLALCACGNTSAPAADPTQAPAENTGDANAEQPAEEDLVTLAQAEGELVVYGSCEEEYLAAACQNFEKLYGIKTTYQRLSTGEVQAKIEEENGNPSADVWFGGTTDPYNVVAAEGLLEAYEAENASHLISDVYRNADGYWYGIYKGILGFMVNTDELTRLNLEAPQDWQDLLKPEYKGLIWLSNYNTAGTAKLVINTMIQKYGHDEAPARARTSAPASASSASASCTMASPRSSTTATTTSSSSSPLPVPPLRSALPPSSRVQSTPTPRSCGSSTHSAPTAST